MHVYRRPADYRPRRPWIGTVPVPPEPPPTTGYEGVTVLNVPLAVRLSTGRRDIHVSADVRELAFRSAVPGGFASCEIRLDRPLRVDPEEIAIYGKLYVYDGRSGEIAWQGRMEDPGRGAGPDGEIWSLRAVGPAAHARDRTVPLIYVERSLERWFRSDISDKGGEDQVRIESTDAPILELQLPQGMDLPNGYHFGRWYRDIAEAGQKLARFAYSHVEGVASVNTQVMSVVQTAFAGGPSRVAVFTDNFTTSPVARAAVVVTDFTNARDIVELRLDRGGATTVVASNTVWSEISGIVVRALLLTKAGAEITTGYTLNTVLASEVVADLLGRLLGQFDGANASIAATTYAIEQLAYPDGVTPAQVLDDLIALEGDHYWAAWEDTAAAKARFEWRAWPTTVAYEADTAHGFDSPGSAGDLYNAVSVRWRDALGRIRRTRRTATVTALDDAGLTREAPLDLGDDAGTTTNAERAGDEFLAQHSSPPNAGELTIAAPILDAEAGRMVDPWLIRPGKLIRVRDIEPRVDALNATDRDGVSVFRVVAVAYDAARNEARLSLDSSPLRLEEMLAAAGGATDKGRRRR